MFIVAHLTDKTKVYIGAVTILLPVFIGSALQGGDIGMHIKFGVPTF
jgi:hypothetical protein